MIRKKSAFILIIFTIGFILPLIGSELVLRLIDRPKIPKHKVGWRNTTSFKSNQLGFRGQTIKYDSTDIVIVLLGDSQVESVISPQDSLPEKRFEHYLNQNNYGLKFKVFTLGASGYGTDQQLLVLKEYFQLYRADAVLLWQTFGNDIWNNIFPTHWSRNGTYKPTFYLENGLLKGPNYSLGDVIPHSKFKLQELFTRAITPKSQGPDENWEAKLPPAYIPLTDYKGVFLNDLDRRYNKNPLLINENLGNEKSHFSMYLYPRSPRMQYGLDLTKALLWEVKKVCDSNKASFYLFNILRPNEPAIDSAKKNRHEYGDRIHLGNDSLLLSPDKIERDSLNDVVVHKIGKQYYRTSNIQYCRNVLYLNKPFKCFYIPIKTTNYKVSKTDPHLNSRAIEEAMKLLSDSITHPALVKNFGN